MFVSTLGLWCDFLMNGTSAWGRFFLGAKNEEGFTTMIYASVLFGEGCLQAAAVYDPKQYAKGAIVFMVPYKLCATLTMLYTYKYPLNNTHDPYSSLGIASVSST